MTSPAFIPARPWRRVGAVFLACALAAPLSQARELAWAVHIASPGVAVGFSNAMPVVVAPNHLVVPPPVVVYPSAMMGPPAYGVAWVPPPPPARHWRGHGHGHWHGYRGHGPRDWDGHRGGYDEGRPGHGWR
jgi:hypothetical protein